MRRERASETSKLLLQSGKGLAVASDDKDYDNNTWAATTWFTFAVQQVAVAFHNAVAQEALDAVGTAAARVVSALSA